MACANRGDGDCSGLRWLHATPSNSQVSAMVALTLCVASVPPNSTTRLRALS